jgi:hypothetical protein
MSIRFFWNRASSIANSIIGLCLKIVLWLLRMYVMKSEAFSWLLNSMKQIPLDYSSPVYLSVFSFSLRITTCLTIFCYFIFLDSVNVFKITLMSSSSNDFGIFFNITLVLLTYMLEFLSFCTFSL